MGAVVSVCYCSCDHFLKEEASFSEVLSELSSLSVAVAVTTF